MDSQPPDDACDYVIVGSGAGGGTLAARLAEAGLRIVLLEAGGDPRTEGEPRLPDDYDVPAFHTLASENPAMSWDFFVRHYADEAQQRCDPKAGAEGVLYPRAATLGGCTAHNAMILVYPHDADWDGIATLTGDRSWRARSMRRYFRRLERCGHRPEWRLLAKLGLDPTGHGWSGWLSTEHARPWQLIEDGALLQTVIEVAIGGLRAGRRPFEALRRLFEGQADPNDRRIVPKGDEAVCYTPLSTDGHRRSGARERVRDVVERFPDRLRVELHALATRVLFEGTRAIGVEYLQGERLYRAHPTPSEDAGEPRSIRARYGVILAGGAFNSPQLLMLSGIGPRETLERHGIPVRVELPGVGQNLQDRYEIGVVNRMSRTWQVLQGAKFEAGDPLYGEWTDDRTGMYVSNGAALAVVKRSTPGPQPADLFCMALLARFPGYYPGYSREIATKHNYLTWAVLKAHTNNRAGTITLRSADPRDTPLIDFHYFDAADDPAGADLKAVVAGIRLVRELSEPLKDLIDEEELPGAGVVSDADIGRYVRDNAWGHHASCSCAIGPRDAGGVVDGDFAVYGAEGLWIVDASVFPRIPGFFVASAVYMIAEKAADVILRHTRQRP